MAASQKAFMTRITFIKMRIQVFHRTSSHVYFVIYKLHENKRQNEYVYSVTCCNLPVARWREYHLSEVAAGHLHLDSTPTSYFGRQVAAVYGLSGRPGLAFHQLALV